MGITKFRQLEKINEKFITHLVNLAKGHPRPPFDLYFYSHLLSLGFPIVNTIDEVIFCLRNAWWIQEEDLYQQCYAYLGTYATNLSSGLVAQYLMRAIARYLVNQEGVFKRQALYEQLEKYPPLVDLYLPDDICKNFGPEAIIGGYPSILGHIQKDEFLRYLAYCFSRGLQAEEINDKIRQSKDRKQKPRIALLLKKNEIKE